MRFYIKCISTWSVLKLVLFIFNLSLSLCFTQVPSKREEADEGPLKVGFEYKLKQGDSRGSLSGSTGYIGSVSLSGEEMQIKIAKNLGNGIYSVYLPKKGRMGDGGKVAGKQKYRYDESTTQIININEWPIIIPWASSSSGLNTINDSDTKKPNLLDSSEEKLYTSIGEGGFEQDALNKAMSDAKIYAINHDFECEVIETKTEKGAYKWMAKVTYKLKKKNP